MKKLDVCFSPDLIHLYDLKGRIVVVVDVLRATSCMTTAFAHGISKIKPVANLEECKALGEKGYITAAERGGEKVEGFDLGNSPFSYMDKDLKGKNIALTTTNGTLAITKSVAADEVIIGSFLNLNAVVKYILNQERDVLIHCAGWKGKFSMEDSIFAGALVEHLKSKYQSECDAPNAAATLYNSAKDDLKEYMADSAHVKRLKNFNVSKDIAFCLTPNQYDVVPKLVDMELTC